MANKFTRKIDEMFARFGRPGDKYIILGYCHSGDEDGGTRDYEYFDCMWESYVDGTHTGPERREHCLYYDGREQEVAFEEDWDELTTMLWDSYRETMGPDFEGTNCYHYRFYAVTKDHKLVTFVSRGDLSDPDEVLIDLDTVSEEQANSAADVQTLGYIYQKCESIENYLNELKDEEFREKAINRIKAMIC
jgi:hypothetical protein